MEQEVGRGFSGSTLKLIAMITMLLDHVGAVIVCRMILARAAEHGMVGVVMDDELYMVYRILRDIGRIAFPIYCFLLVEGFEKTHSLTKYALRLGVFALVSEIPFDFALSSRVWNPSYQNVFFTLLIGLLTMIMAEKLENKLRGTSFELYSFVIGIAVTALGAGLAECLQTDYGAKGILCIMVLFLFRKNKLIQTIGGALAFMWEKTAPLAFLPIWFYNGKRGLKLKYVFYLFYPLHLLVLYLICVVMGLAGYPAT